MPNDRQVQHRASCAVPSIRREVFDTVTEAVPGSRRTRAAFARQRKAYAARSGSMREIAKATASGVTSSGRWL
jgi:hypothetical protein